MSKARLDAGRGSAAPNILGTVSRAVSRAERMVLRGSVGAILCLITVNIVLTAFGAPLYWANEAAVSLVAFTTFVGASVLTFSGEHPSVSLARDFLPPKIADLLIKAADLFMLCLALVLIYLSWRLFAPLDVVRHDFDLMAFAIEAGNFVYQEPTNTLGISKAWIWLAPVPTFFTMALHAAARLFGGVPDRMISGDAQ